MTGDTADMAARIRAVLPGRWFSGNAPILGAVLTGFGSAWGALYGLLQAIRAQGRIVSASGILLDIAAMDFFGARLPRKALESDGAYSTRIRANLTAPNATRQAVTFAVQSLTGRAPVLFEPRNTADTGGYATNALGYGVCGGYGSLGLPYQFFVQAYRPDATPLSGMGGYNAGPGAWNAAPMAYADTADIPGTVTDADIFAAIAGVLPANAVAWTRISN